VLSDRLIAQVVVLVLRSGSGCPRHVSAIRHAGQCLTGVHYWSRRGRLLQCGGL